MTIGMIERRDYTIFDGDTHKKYLKCAILLIAKEINKINKDFAQCIVDMVDDDLVKWVRAGEFRYSPDCGFWMEADYNEGYGWYISVGFAN